MKFITIQNQVDQTVAINPDRITHIAIAHDSVVVFLGSGEKVFTKFTNLRSAVEYVERATAERSWKEIHWSEETHLDNSRSTDPETVELSQGEVRYLSSKKLGTSEWALYMCLSSHCERTKSSCNLSFAEMVNWFDGTKTEKTLVTNMTTLVKKGVVIRKGKNDEDRWNLTYKVDNESQLSEDSL